MAVERDEATVRYCSRRRWPGPHSGGGEGHGGGRGALAPRELGAFDHYLTARRERYTPGLGPMLARSCVEHEPWPLYRAVVRELEGNLLAAAGLPDPRASRWCTGRQGRDQDRPVAPLGRT